MTRRFGGLLALPLIWALAALLAPPAHADTYTDALVAKFNAQTHVVADPAASPPLQNPDALNEQILTGRWTWSSAPPVWVAAVAPAQTGVTTPDAIHDVMVRRNPDFSGVILVIDAKGYHVRAYNVPKAVADNVDRLMGQAARDNRNDPRGAARQFVARLTAVEVAPGAPVTSSPAVHQKHTSWTWLWVLLTIVALVLATIGLVSFVASRNRKRRKDSEAREQFKQELIAAESDVADLDNAVLAESTPDVSAEQLKANAGLHDARKASETGDYTAALAHLRAVRSTVDKADRKLNPGKYAANPEEDPKQAQVRAKNPDTGQYVTINNTDYRAVPQPGYPHYYGGGYYNGMFFNPGYYPYAFWGPGWGWGLADVVVLDALLDDRWSGGYGGYERGFEAGRDSAFADSGSTSGQSAGYDSQQANVGFDGGYSSSGGEVGFGGGYDSGGGNFDFGGGSDSGGGFDSGGGSDFGGGSDSGGGFDSGGGDFGF
ncbi:hypothetical protein [Mycobacterium sp. IS-1264]|uniref:hypothetical protein n=1 Tax=Mycobacterium sp. IS-1264 TaxID=1834158 RepID=UPI00096BD5DB|nr:hypothetical protein [Mycobacterium sp. IS-1264]OMC47476.1 hypothetical protein A5744_07350 [Mycobacterium sp. IS-1264]